MRRLFLVAVLSVLTLAAVPARAEAPDFLSAEAVTAGGGCVLPDLTGLSEDEQEAALIAAGFETRSEKAAPPACPATFLCSSIGNCAAGPLCAIGSLGSPCCTVGGLARCCINGNNISVITCPCRCTANPCAASCPASNNVTLHC